MNILILIFTIVFVLFFTIRPVRIGKIKIGMAIASILALAFLFLLGVIDVEIIRRAIMDNGSFKPWEIIVIFFTVAYVSISIDVTGIFDYLAYLTVRKAQGNGKRLFLFFYIFAGVLSIFTSNDIVILTLTPIIFYLGRHAKINIVPLLFAEFFAANTLSMFLYIDNPTNIMVANALHIGFLEYASVMFFPTLVAAIINYYLLKLVFRKVLTKQYKVDESSDFHVRNWVDAFLSIFLMAFMFLSLVFSSYLKIPIWVVTSVFCFIFVIEDLCFSMYYYKKSKKISVAQSQKAEDVFSIPKEKNEFWLAIKRVPWEILPFVVAFFVIIEAFGHFGLVSGIASFISEYSVGLASSIGLTGIFSFLLANIINNQPMTIFFTHIFISDTFLLVGQNMKGSAYALIIASNLGANLTIVGALAGLMWKRILEIKDLKISYWQFFKVGIVVTPLVFVSSLITLYLVLL